MQHIYTYLDQIWLRSEWKVKSRISLCQTNSTRMAIAVQALSQALGRNQEEEEVNKYVMETLGRWEY